MQIKMDTVQSNAELSMLQHMEKHPSGIGRESFRFFVSKNF
jgi:hypothetical protein